jgi:PAS domain S-box-containing protein
MSDGLRLAKALIIAALLLCSLGTAIANEPAPPASRSILIINSYHAEYPWTRGQIDGFVDEVRRQYPDTQIFSEFLDSKRIDGAACQRSFARLLVNKYNGMTFGLVYATDDIALNFSQTFAEHVWDHNTPIVASGINHFTSLDRDMHPLTVGVAEREDGAKVVALAQKLVPDAKRVLIIADSTDVGLEMGGQVEEQVRMTSDLPIVKTPPMGRNQLLDFVAAQGTDTIFLLVQYTVDGDSRYNDPLVLTREIAQRAHGPVFVFNEMFLSAPEIVGGYINRAIDQGHAAGELAVKLMAGTKPAALPASSEAAYRWTFNYGALQRFGISLDALPAGSIIIGKPTNFIYEHIILFTCILAGIALQMLLIVYLLFNINKRRIITEKLSKSEAQLRLIFENSPLAIYIADPDGKLILINNKFRAILGYSLPALRDLDTLRSTLMPDPLYREHVCRTMTENVLTATINGSSAIPVEFRARTKGGIDAYASASCRT